MPIQVNGALRRAPCPVQSCPACEPNSGSVHPSLSMNATQVERGRHCYAIMWVLVPNISTVLAVARWDAGRKFEKCEGGSSTRPGLVTDNAGTVPDNSTLRSSPGSEAAQFGAADARRLCPILCPP
jgi:hypothetical protein